MAEGFKKYLGVEKRFPYAFPHPIFNYDVENERRIFFENAMTIYNNAKTMTPLHCDGQCEERLDIALKSGKKDDWETCTDIDECQSGNSVCPWGQTCFNTPGSKVCCEDGLWPNCTDTSRSKEGVLDE